MTLLTHKLSKSVLAEPVRLVTLLLFLVIFGVTAALAQTEQVSFTATGTAVITGVTKLPGGLTQMNFNTSGKATHLGDFTGTVDAHPGSPGNLWLHRGHGWGQRERHSVPFS